MADATLEIDLKTSESSKNKTIKEARSTGGKAGAAFGAGFSARMKGIVAAALTGVAVRAVVKASAQQEAAVNKLNVALKTAGDFSRASSIDMQNFASSLQQVSRFGDETTLEMLALAKGMGATNEQAKELVQAAANASEALGIDFQTAVRGIGQTLSGQAGTLGRYVGSIRNLTADQLKAGGAIDLINKQFSGAALGAINTYEGATDQLSNTWGDLLEVVGDFVTKNPIVINAIQGITKSIQGMTQSISQSSGEGIRNFTIGLSKVGEAVSAFLIAPLEFGFNAAKVIFFKIAELIPAMMATIGKGAGLVADLMNSFGINNQFTKALDDFNNKHNEVFQGVAARTQQAQENIFSFPMAEKALEMSTSLENLALSAQNSSEKITQAFNKTQNKAGSTASIVIATGKQIADGFGNGIAAAVGALANGENAMDAFAGVILNTIGDMAINIGKTLIGIGIGIDALKASLGSLTGGIAIAAGVALIASGALVKSFAGKLTGAATAATAGLGGGGGVATTASEPTITEETTLADQEPKTNVSLVVNGNIFDSDDTGERLVGLLNSAFDQKGVVLNANGVA